jgi:ATP-dependent exoDNAse (exonuclease V) beta subunit
MMREQPHNSDQAARTRALDPATSFIVQAPAGSGKTGLLTQRYLVLLAGAEAPEEIVAITFTRKAAGEMRQRILQALADAAGGIPPEQDGEHYRQTRDLARRALARDQAQGWQLRDNPVRLRIQTIDALCAGLARQMPVLSRLGALPAIAEDPARLYLEAARNTIAELETGAQWSAAIALLVQHLDNRVDKLQGLIATMLARRDQWLRHVADPDHPGLERATLEAALAGLVTEVLAGLVHLVPDFCREELSELARFAAANLPDTNSPIAACTDLHALPGWQVMDRAQWAGLAELLLTRDGAWRKRLDKNQGFPSPGGARDQAEKVRFTAMKQRMTALLESLQGADTMREQLARVRDLPPHHYSDAEWQTLQALVELLRVAAAHLELVFSARGQVDFPALIQAANRALGDPEAPTDLALALDYRMRHLLVDEFQDTSFNQYELLKRLTAGWQPGDGHTLFVVGDPMQSIYRFREAEVGLFLDAREHGLGQVPLEFLRLEVNFRSQQGIVDWINQAFPEILPTCNDLASGAVIYAPATAFHPPLAAAAVTIHPALERDDTAEALQVAALVRQAQSACPDGTTAILVRSRTHLAQIVGQLQQSGLRFQAVEIEQLAHRPVVQDLLALTRALIHAGDRIAWLAVLRAPLCGLTLGDLYTLAGQDHHRTVFDLLQEEQRLAQLSEDGRCRIARVLPVLKTALAERARGALRSYIEGVWIALGGPACVTDKTDLEDAEVYLQLLEKPGGNGEFPDIHELDRQVEQLFALPDVTADASLQLMTVHKAKGLEFDTVIMPGLGRSPRHDDEKLLYWLERGRASGNSDLLLAPVSAEGEDRNRIAVFLQQLEKARGRYEDGRLLYVAATRARQRLHLMGHTVIQEQDGRLTAKIPPQASLLARLWPVVADNFQALLEQSSYHTAGVENLLQPALHTPMRYRLAPDWTPPPPPGPVEVDRLEAEPAVEEQVEFDWAGETARQVGTVVHRLLRYLGKSGIDRISVDELHRFGQIGHRMLVQLGVPENRLAFAVTEITAALQTVLEDERGRWILSSQHENAGCELALSGLRNGVIDHMIIDRTFVDKHGTRWIIDYKTGAHSGGGVDEFLDREQQRYRRQLERYAGVMRRMETRPTRLGLYFPLLKGWREWPSGFN